MNHAPSATRNATLILDKIIIGSEHRQKCLKPYTIYRALCKINDIKTYK
jgi:hypothetical protein